MLKKALKQPHIKKPFSKKQILRFIEKHLKLQADEILFEYKLFRRDLADKETNWQIWNAKKIDVFIRTTDNKIYIIETDHKLSFCTIGQLLGYKFLLKFEENIDVEKMIALCKQTDYQILETAKFYGIDVHIVKRL